MNTIIDIVLAAIENQADPRQALEDYYQMKGWKYNQFTINSVYIHALEQINQIKPDRKEIKS